MNPVSNNSPDAIRQAFIDAVRHARPANRAVRALVVADRFADAADAARRWRRETGDPEPLVAVAIALAHSDDSMAVALRAEADFLAETEDGEETKIGLRGELRDLLVAALDGCNASDDESVSTAAQIAAMLGHGATLSADDALSSELDPFPTLKSVALARAADHREVGRRLRASGSGLASVCLDLFRTGRPELALVDARCDQECDEVGACCWWLAAIQTGVLARELDRIAAALEWAPGMQSVLIAEGETVLGHTGAPSLPSSVVDEWAQSVSARRRSRGARISGAWSIVARPAERVDGTDQEDAYALGRVHLQNGRWDDAATAFAKAADATPDPRRHGELLAAAAAAASLSDSGMERALRFVDRALGSAPDALSVTATALELRSRGGIGGGTNALLRRLEAIADGPVTDDQDVDTWNAAADAYARAVGSNDAGIALLERAVDAHPKSTTRWLALVEFRERLGDFAQAAIDREEAARTEKDPIRRAAIYADVGDVYMDVLDEPLPALENYLVSFVCWSGSRATFDRLERLCRTLGRHKDLQSAFELALEYARRRPHEAEIGVEELLRRRSGVTSA